MYLENNFWNYLLFIFDNIFITKFKVRANVKNNFRRDFYTASLKKRQFYFNLIIRTLKFTPILSFFKSSKLFSQSHSVVFKLYSIFVNVIN